MKHHESNSHAIYNWYQTVIMCHKRDSLWAHCFPSFCRWIRIKYILIWLMQYTAENFNKFEFTIGLKNDAKRCICDEWCNFLTLSWRQNHLRDKKPVFIELAHMFRERKKIRFIHEQQMLAAFLNSQSYLTSFERERERWKWQQCTEHFCGIWHACWIFSLFLVTSCWTFLFKLD